MYGLIAALGIGGGLAGLIWAWVADCRKLRRDRLRCSRFGFCFLTVRSRAEEADLFNAQLRSYQEQLKSMRGQLERALAELKAPAAP